MKYYIHILLITFILIFSIATPTYASKIKISAQPESQITRISGTAIFTVKAKGKGLSYQWYCSKNKKKWKKLKCKSATLKVVGTLTKNNQYYRCVISKKGCKTKKTKIVKLTVSDINRRYGYQLNRSVIRGYFYPKALDGYCYVAPYIGVDKEALKMAIKTINKNTETFFVYTQSLHIADIIIMNYSQKITQRNMYTKENVVDILNSKQAEGWSAVTFSDDQNYEHFLIALNYYHLKNYSHKEIASIIIHELGHCIHIPHSNNLRDIMFYSMSGVTKMTTADIAIFKKNIKIYKQLTR